MYKQFYEGLQATHLPLATLFLFIAVFAVSIIRLFVIKKKQDFDGVAQLPLGDDHE